MHFDDADIAIVRAEAERLIDMYQPQQQPHQLGKAMLRVIARVDDGESETISNYRAEVERLRGWGEMHARQAEKLSRQLKLYRQAFGEELPEPPTEEEK
jgi:hypothetical protein